MDDLSPADLKTILHSHRANLYYLEHCRVLVNGGRVEYVTDEGRRSLYWNIPIANTTALLLGTGTSITQAAIRELATAVSAHGEFNFLLSNGTCLFAHCATRLSYIVRKAPFASAHLKDQDITVDFTELTTPGDRVAVVATTPLTDNEEWTPIAPGTLMLFVDGAAVDAGPASTCTLVESRPTAS